MRDTSTPARQVTYNRFRPDSNAPRDEVVRVFRTSPERVQIQLRNEKHYMSASLDAVQVRAVVDALNASLQTS